MTAYLVNRQILLGSLRVKAAVNTVPGMSFMYELHVFFNVPIHRKHHFLSQTILYI